MSNPDGHTYTGPGWLGPTLCWDCANAVGRCCWSDRFEPVEGWDAVYDAEKDSYHVIACPLFERDAYCGGLRRMQPEERRYEFI